MSTLPPKPAPLERRKIAEQIADALKDAIVGGGLKAGEALPSERDLAEQYDVNRSSIREAMRRLEAWGLVEIKQGGATRVRDFLMSAGLSLLPHFFEVGKRIEPELLRDVHELRAVLLAWCAEQAATRADAASLNRLDDVVRRMRVAQARPSELQELDYVFFEELVRITGNRVLWLFSNVVRDVYMRGRDHFLGLYSKDVFDIAHHEQAVAAIRAKDAAGASAAMRAHAKTALRSLEAKP